MIPASFAPTGSKRGTPGFLLETLLRRQVGPVELEGMSATDELVSRFDVDDMSVQALLFQTGYLTIEGEEEDVDGEPLYRLGYPNREVRQSLNRSLLRHLTRDDGHIANRTRLLGRLKARDFDGLEELFGAFFAGIPYEWYTNNAIARYEGYYAAVFYAYFASLGLDVRAEESTSRGRLDMSLRFEGDVFLFEFKVLEQAGPGSALAQLRDRGYAEKFRATAAAVYLVGVEFESAKRNIAAFAVERAQSQSPL